MKLTRYSLKFPRDCQPTIHADDDGDFCMEADVTWLEAENERLREALEFYRDRSNYEPRTPSETVSRIWRDFGMRAHQVLSTPETKAGGGE